MLLTPPEKVYGTADASTPLRSGDSATDALRSYLLSGQVLPAHPLALTSSRRLDEKRQQALTRYYVAAGAGGLAVGVHTTQFAIREPKHALFQPVLEMAATIAEAALQQEAGSTGAGQSRPFALIAGICGQTPQAVREAQIARSLGYHAGLLSLSAFATLSEEAALQHCRAVAAVIPVVGFYLQPAVGGRVFSYGFWRQFFEIDNVVAVKIAPFNRYQTIDVVRAVIATGRDDVALYTGNDDSIVTDLLTDWEFVGPDGVTPVRRRIVGGLLGHWAAWTKRAVELLEDVKEARAQASADALLSPEGRACIDLSWLTRAVQVTDSNAALFDAANGFRGCIAGIHEVLRRQGLLAGTWCLDPEEDLSPGQAAEIDRIYRSYPQMTDDDFVAANLDKWLR